MKIFFTMILPLLMVGCVSYAPSVPDGYTGDIATVDDSFQRQSRSKANFYYIKLIDGKPIINSLMASSSASSGKGRQLIARGASRRIPIKPLSLYIVGQVHHSAPVGYMFSPGSNYIVEGEVNFTPEKDARYLVNGRLSEAYSAVWIEDTNGNVVSKIVEKKAPSYVPMPDSDDQQKAKDLSREELFLKLAGGESESLVVSKLGKPNSVSTYGGNFLIEKPPSVTYEYEGLGSIQFSAHNSKALFVEKVSVKLASDISSIKTQLGGAGATLQSLAKSSYQQDDIETEVLDLFAEKIWTEKNTADPYVIDALSWFCKVLAKSNNSRYRSLLQDVANTASADKLKKYAKNSLDLLPATGVDQFTPAGK